MPELPEVETVRQGLREVIEGAVFSAVEQRRPDLRTPFPDNLPARLQGRRIITIGRRAKYILFTLDDQSVMALHLGMSGRVLVMADGSAYKPAKHDHLVCRFDSGALFVLNDPRRFGMVFMADADDIMRLPAFAKMGPEPLGNGFSGTVLREKLAGRKTPIKTALLDQRIVAGLGNIYVCEALYYAGISPLRAAGALSDDEAEKLVQEIKKVLSRAIKAGGSSLKDYRTASGELGYFQFSFAVYDRAGKACPDCSCDVSRTGGIKRIVQGGRSTFYCDEKQR